ncbi:MAG TPA: RDD family protein [Microlunatus sp.]
MSDIPIGSPPVPPGRHAAPQGWYPDPVDGSQERYWDGWSWSRNTRPSESAGPAGPVPAGTFGGHPAGPQTGYGPGGYGRPGQGTGHGTGGFQHGGYQQGGYGRPGYGQQPHPPVGTQPRTPAAAVTTDGVPLAGWGWRFLAAVIDLICYSILSTIFAIPIYLKLLPVISQYFSEAMAAAESGRQPPMLTPSDLALSTTDQLTLTGITIVVGLLYFGLFWRFLRATPGQLLCGLRVVPAGNGTYTDRLPWQQALVRALIFIVPFAVGSYLMLFAVLNALLPLWNANRQAIHDIAARTQLVRIK